MKHVFAKNRSPTSLTDLFLFLAVYLLHFLRNYWIDNLHYNYSEIGLQIGLKESKRDSFASVLLTESAIVRRRGAYSSSTDIVRRESQLVTSAFRLR